ncbi:hypothetical protein ACOME3_008535 [Neoechinorhynchus agilis]
MVKKDDIDSMAIIAVCISKRLDSLPAICEISRTADLKRRAKFCLDVANLLIINRCDLLIDRLRQIISALFNSGEIKSILLTNDDLCFHELRILISVVSSHNESVAESFKSIAVRNNWFDWYIRYADLAVRSNRLSRGEFEHLMTSAMMPFEASFEAMVIMATNWRKICIGHPELTWIYWIYELSSENARALNAIRDGMVEEAIVNATNYCPMNKALYKDCLAYQLNNEKSSEERSLILNRSVKMMEAKGLRIRLYLLEFELLLQLK